VPHEQTSGSHPPVALRTVAVVEALKGVLACLVGAGLFSLIHRDLDEVAARAIEFFHVRPDGHISDLLFAAADHATEKTLVEFGLVVLLYATLRFTEAYGLWRERAWGEWIAITSGCLYLPLEVHGLMHRARPLKWVLLLLNIAIVGYLLGRRLHAGMRKAEVAAG
jgi:uncharacterized membrane protein (DUF2068 family)